MKTDKKTAEINGKRWDLEFLRIVACFLVIFNHTAGFTLYRETEDGLSEMIYTGLSALTTLNVPTFFMISGILLFNKDETYSFIVKQRFLRILSRLVAFITILYVIFICQQGLDFSLYSLLCYVVSGPQEINGDPYWFLYSYLSFLIMLPILKKIAWNFKREDFRIFLLVHFLIFSVAPVAGLLFKMAGRPIGISNYFLEPLSLVTCKPLFYSLVGYYMDQYIEIDARKIKLLSAVSVFALIVTVIMAICEKRDTGECTQRFIALFDYMFAITLVAVLIYLYKKYEISGSLKRLIIKMGEGTFGIYLFEPALRLALGNVIGRFILNCTSYTIIHSLLWCLLSFATGAFVTFLLKKMVRGIKEGENAGCRQNHNYRW